MEYELGKFLEMIDTKLDIILKHIGYELEKKEPTESPSKSEKRVAL